MKRDVLERTTFIRAPLAEVFEFFSSPENLGRITPPAMGFRITNGPGRRIREGDRIDYVIRVAGVPMRWRTRITQWQEGELFADLQERGPYRYWHHVHRFRAAADGVEMHDRVEYELPLGWLGRLFGGWLVRRQLKQIFDYRAEVITRLFA
jgi:ligand-binding SRPBCC domain-containing protein